MLNNFLVSLFPAFITAYHTRGTIRNEIGWQSPATSRATSADLSIATSRGISSAVSSIRGVSPAPSKGASGGLSPELSQGTSRGLSPGFPPATPLLSENFEPVDASDVLYVFHSVCHHYYHVEKSSLQTCWFKQLGVIIRNSVGPGFTNMVLLRVGDVAQILRALVEDTDQDSGPAGDTILESIESDLPERNLMKVTRCVRTGGCDKTYGKSKE